MFYYAVLQGRKKPRSLTTPIARKKPSPTRNSNPTPRDTPQPPSSPESGYICAADADAIGLAGIPPPLVPRARRIEILLHPARETPPESSDPILTGAPGHHRRQLAMAQPPVSPQDGRDPHAPEQRVVVRNKHGENLVGRLHHTGSNKVVVLCHGFAASKDDSIMIDLAAALTKQGISAFRFDFSGNGESQGEFQYGNYRKEADDLHSVVSYLKQEKYDVTGIVGHSKGGNVVILYASIHGDVPVVVNLSGRFYLEKGVEEHLGKEFMDRINKEGYIEVTSKSGNILYTVTKESLMERLNTDMRAASLSISKECRFFTIHGSADKIIPVEDAYEFAKLIPNHKLHIIKKANHGYTSHRKQLCDAVVDSITSNEDTPHARGAHRF
ncbi:hypothetical protein ACP70R_037715 [Stipagrostis hirtigluma subsp. patula]